MLVFHNNPFYLALSYSITSSLILLYLSILCHLQAVASIYDEFQEHISIPKLAKALYELANTHPYQAEGLSPHIQNSQQRGEGDDEEVCLS